MQQLISSVGVEHGSKLLRLRAISLEPSPGSPHGSLPQAHQGFALCPPLSPFNTTTLHPALFSSFLGFFDFVELMTT